MELLWGALLLYAFYCSYISHETSISRSELGEREFRWLASQILLYNYGYIDNLIMPRMLRVSVIVLPESAFAGVE
jgi:hypothetical protein